MRTTWRGILDDTDEVLRSIGSRRGRTAMLVLAVALSVGTAVASVGIGRTAALQIAGDLAATIQDDVTLSAGTGADVRGGALFPPDADARAARLALVESAGTRLDVDAARAGLRRVGFETDVSRQPAVWAVSEGYLEAIGVHHVLTWAFGTDNTQPVALVGRRAAEQLGVAHSAGYSGASVLVGGHNLAVVGTVSSTERTIDDVVLVPYSLGVAVMGGDSSARMLVHTAPGAGAGVASALPVAVRPEAPTALTASRVVDLSALRAGVDSQLSRLTGMLGVVLLLITGLLIGNATASSVATRTAEIGLRRALGAGSSVIVRLFLGEGALIGLVGGTLGSTLGAWLVVAVSATYGWSTVLSLDLVVIGVALGLGTGLLASGYPALRVSQIRPADAVRVE